MSKIKEPRRVVIVGETALTEMPAAETVTLAKGFEASVNGLIVKGKPGIDLWSEVGRTLRVLERSAQFAIGDFLIRIEEQLGEEASQVVDYSEGWKEKTCDNYRWLASRIAPADRRMDRLGVRHHQLVARLASSRQRYWLTQAAADSDEHPWTVARLRAALKSGEDIPPSALVVIVTVKDEEQQQTLMSRLISEGYNCKPGQRRERKADKSAAA